MAFFMRTPRQWMKVLADKLGFSSTENQHQMFAKKVGFKASLQQIILDTYNRTPFPPLEWLFNYELLFNLKLNDRKCIDMGSKFIKTENDFYTYVESGLGVFSFNSRKVNILNFKLLTYLMKKRNFKGFIFYSEFSRKSLATIFEKYNKLDVFNEFDNGVIYPHTLELKKNLKASQQENIELKRILFCSSSFNLKGGRELVTAFTELKKKYNVELYIVTTLSEVPKDLLLSSSINFIQFGSSSDRYYSLIELCDLIVHPTYFDTHAISLLEANKAGLPFIATDTFALSELVTPGSGVFVNNPYCAYSANDGRALFRGRALDYANSLSCKESNSTLAEELYFAIEKVLLDFESYHAAANLNSKINLTSKYITKQWNDLMLGESNEQ